MRERELTVDVIRHKKEEEREREVVSEAKLYMCTHGEAWLTLLKCQSC